MKLVYERCEVPAATGTSLPVVDDAIAAGHLRTYLVGRKRKATVEAVQAWIAFLQAQSDAGTPVCYRARSTERRAA